MSDVWPEHPATTIAGGSDWPDHPVAALSVAPTLPPSRDEILPAAPYNSTAALAHGMTFGLSDAAAAALAAGMRYMKGDTPNFDYSQAAREMQRGREAYAGQAPWSSTGANLAGSLVGGGPASAAIARTASGARKLMLGALTGGTLGGVQGAADNNTSINDAGAGAQRGLEIGASLGAVPAAAGMAMRTLLPGTASPAVQLLRQAGVEPTPGSTAGGIPGTLENLVGRIPLLGAPVQAGRTNATQQFNNAIARKGDEFNRGAVNHALAPIGESLDANTATGHAAIGEMANKASAAYNAAVPNAGAAVDTQASAAIAKARANLFLRAPGKVDQFDNYLQEKLISPIGGGNNRVLPGQAFKDLESDLGGEVARLRGGNNTSDDRALGTAYRQTQAAMRDNLQRNSPQTAQDLANANETWRRLLPVRDAAERDINGIITPQSLFASARKFSNAAQTSRGFAPMQDFAQNASAERQAFADAGKTVLRPGGGGHGLGEAVGGGMLGAGLVEGLLQHPDPRTLGLIAATYPTLGAIYSNTGRGMVNKALGGAGGIFDQLAPAAPAAPLAAQFGWIGQ